MRAKASDKEVNMEKQIIISIGREYGSGGHEIGRHLAEKFGLPMYDHNLLDEIAENMRVDKEKLAKYDELPKKFFMARSVRGYSNSPEEAIAQMQFNFLRDKAAAGESFVVIGRCSETVLKEFEGLIPIFVMGDWDAKVKRVMDHRNFTEKQAVEAINRHDKKRKAYHNRHCDAKWGDSRNYDICINSSRLGIDGTMEYLADYVDRKIKQNEK